MKLLFKFLYLNYFHLALEVQVSHIIIITALSTSPPANLVSLYGERGCGYM